MESNAMFGVMLHAIGGLAAASFYIPFKGVKKWSWETYWLVGGFFSWIIAPWVLALIFVPNLFEILSGVPLRAAGLAMMFGMLWGVGGLTFGLSMRYLGISLGYALALGFCAAFGTLVPPIYNLFVTPDSESPVHVKTIVDMLQEPSGQVVLLGVLVCLLGIAICGKAGILKERELSDEQKKNAIREFNLWKGTWVAIFAGIMSACMAFAINAGKPIAARALEYDTPILHQNLPLFIFIMFGGFVTNCVWCIILHRRNRSGGQYVDARTPLLSNYLFSALAGFTWFLQFTFYGMGTTQMGKYDFSSWTLHMSFIIIFSNVWGLVLLEWRGASVRTKAWITAGIAVLILSTIVVGYGNNLA